MSKFTDRLARLKKRVEAGISPENLEVMHRSTAELIASGIEGGVLGVGDEMPSFDLPNQDGMQVDGQALLQKGPLVITFYRGFWCPYCNADLENLDKYMERIEAAGGSLLAISPELPVYSQRIIRRRKLRFPILFDQGNEVAARFGLRWSMKPDLMVVYRDAFGIDLESYHGDAAWTLPMPARFLVDREGVIRYAEAAADYTTRPDPDDLLQVLAGLPS